MILNPESVSIASELPPNVVRDHLCARAKEWRESALTETAKKAGIIGWRVKENGERITVRARMGGRNSFVPHFVGFVHASGTGSLLCGDLRLSWHSRLFMTIWLTAVAIAPALAVVDPLTGDTAGKRLLGGLLLLIPSAALFAAGRWMVQSGRRAPAAAIRELLTVATERTAEPSNASIASLGG